MTGTLGFGIGALAAGSIGLWKCSVYDYYWALAEQDFTSILIPGPNINKKKIVFDCMSTRTQII